MRRRTYNKLVRDKIPQVMDAKGKTYEIRELTDGDYLQALLKKLLEEAKETADSEGDVSEIADVVEVLMSLCKAKGITWSDVEKERKRKKESRGGFTKRLFLVDVDE